MHPLDLVKTRFQLQSTTPMPGQPHYTSIANCMKTMYHTEGIFSFWKGILPPLFVETPKRAWKVRHEAILQYFWRLGHFSFKILELHLMLNSFSPICKSLMVILKYCFHVTNVDNVLSFSSVLHVRAIQDRLGIWRTWLCGNSDGIRKFPIRIFPFSFYLRWW